MGLDIAAYSRLIKVINPGKDRGDLITLTDNTDFPGRIAPQTEGQYTHGEEMDVIYMGYGRYNHWREWLAKLAGYTPVGNNPNLPSYYSGGAWAATSGPFWELICFSDCEGTIGTDACRKLLKDFNEWEQRAQDNSTGPEFDHYVDMHNGLKLAAQGGCLKFS